MKFIDEAIIDVKAGHGGPGCVSFRREKYVPRGGPDGGHGGRGGNIVLQTTPHANTLIDFTFHRKFIAPDGERGGGCQCDGRAGDDLLIDVPVGTAVYDHQTGELLADLTGPDQRVTICEGGRGGKGNAFFVTSTNQAPRHAQPGEDGAEKTLRLELKLLADVGLIGLPNAGKSSFLASVSAARPKVADYPFTTIQPVLGVVTHKDATPFVIADLPGLIEGASEGRGMGDRFLKHAERTRVILHFISCSPLETDDVITRYDTIEHELNSYFAEHADGEWVKKRHMMIILTQIDLIDSKTLKEWTSDLKKHTGQDVMAISSATRKNVDALLDDIVARLR